MSDFRRFLFASITLVFAQSAWAADEVINPWQDAVSSVVARQASADNSARNVLVTKGRRLTADLTMLAAEFSVDDGLIVSLPLPNGEQANYRFSKSTVMADELARKYPQIQTFSAQDVDNSANKGSFDLTPKGFHGMFKHDGEWVFIDPEMRNDTGSYVAYFSKDARAISNRIADKVLGLPDASELVLAEKSIYSSRPVLGETLRTYRLAVSASAEYTKFHGGTVSDGLAAITTMINRLNEVYQRDLSVRFELVANNDEVVYTNASLDPFNNTDEDLEQNPAVLNGVIGVHNYDIGHVVNTGGGGLAFLGGICDDVNKAYGMTGTSFPTGDAFYIDYVAHEIGHQLGANHTFNGTNLNCGGSNRNGPTAWEPGSGSTIMSYAGICGSQDLQDNSDSFFHSGSIEEMLVTIEAAACGTSTPLTNSVPTVDAGSDYIIPANTPFKLVGSATDANNDALNYSWDEYDIGDAALSLTDMVDNGNRPLFRSWALADTAERYFPRFQDVLQETGYTTIGESYPTTNRDLTFRLTVRDDQGGVATDETIITTTSAAGPFKVTEPTAETFWEEGEHVVIRWDVAGTDEAPVSCHNVNISLSTDGGGSFGNVLASVTPNDGKYEYTVGEFESSTARVIVRCLENVFFAVNSGNLSINQVPGTPVEEIPEETTTSNKSGGGGFPVTLILMLLILLIRPVKLVGVR